MDSSPMASVNTRSNGRSQNPKSNKEQNAEKLVFISFIDNARVVNNH